MGIFAAISLIILLIFLFVTKNYQKELFDKKEICYPSAWFLLNRCHLKQLFPEQEMRRFSSLFVNENKEVLIRNYQCKRISYGIYGIFVVLIFLLCYSAGEAGQEKEISNQIERPGFGEGSEERTVDITLSSEEKKEIRKQLDFQVREKEYTKKEWKKALKKVTRYLDRKILGKNKSNEEIMESLNLVSSYPESSIKIKWNRDSQYIQSDGKINNTWESKKKIPAEGVITEVTAEISCGSYHAEHSIYLKILPKKYSMAEEAWHSFVTNVLKQEEQTRKEDLFSLPETVGNFHVVFHEEKDSTPQVLGILGIVFVVLAMMVPERELKEKEKQREKQLLLDYPKILNKFALFIGAGLSVRGVFEKLAAEYKKQQEKGGEKRYVYEEITAMVRFMKNGGSEAVAMEEFGKRIRLAEYLRFTSLMIQNQKKGSNELLLLLENESVSAMERNREIVRIMGEEAGTKLLLPMVIMLCVVFFVMIVPAFITL